MKFKLYFYLLLFILSFNLVYAVQPTVVVTTSTTGYEIEPLTFRVIKSESLFNLNWHVFNISNNMLLKNNSVSCLIHLYNTNGSQRIEDKASFLQDDFFYIINTSNLVDGIYPYMIYCNSSSLAGFLTSELEVSRINKEANPLFLIALIVGIFLLSFSLLYFASTLAEDHIILDLIAKFTALFILLYLPKVMLDIFNYQTTFKIYLAYIWFLSLFGIYLFLYYLVYVPMVKWNWIKPFGGKKV